MQKRKLAYTLLLVGLMFVGVVHFVLATFAFDTGLDQIGLLLAGLAFFGILLVNFGIAPPPEEESGEAESD
jgi:ABC-type antimicrobial peptide transport system permease subunit